MITGRRSVLDGLVFLLIGLGGILETNHRAHGQDIRPLDAEIDRLVTSVMASTDPKQRSRANDELVWLAKKDMDAVAPRMIALLTDPDPNKRLLGVHVLIFARFRDENDCPGVASALKSKYLEVRLWAAAVRSVEDEESDWMPAFREAIVHEMHQYRKLAAWVAQLLGPAAKPAIPELFRLLDDEHFSVRASAATAFEEMKAEGVAALPKLFDRLMIEPDSNVRMLLQMAIRKIATDSMDVQEFARQPGFDRLLQSKYLDVRMWGVEAVLERKPRPKNLTRVREILEEGAKSSDTLIRRDAERHLRRLKR